MSEKTWDVIPTPEHSCCYVVKLTKDREWVAEFRDHDLAERVADLLNEHGEEDDD